MRKKRVELAPFLSKVLFGIIQSKGHGKENSSSEGFVSDEHVYYFSSTTDQNMRRQHQQNSKESASDANQSNMFNEPHQLIVFTS